MGIQKIVIPGYKKIGLFPKSIASKIGVEPGGIYISKGNLDHIKNEHSTELKQLGISAEFYIKSILKNYNQVRQGTGTSLLLVVFDNLSKVAAIDITVNVHGNWELKTVQPRSKYKIEKKLLLWEKEKAE
ncbi:MAG: hypothetical protein MJ197_04390 [Bacteroidales bacterium]|nr:hypothetical protein [Bacteroidales bacterium]